MTADYRHAGLLRGGASKKMRGTCNLEIGCRPLGARLSEQLGLLQLELTQAVAARFLDCS